MEQKLDLHLKGIYFLFIAAWLIILSAAMLYSEGSIAPLVMVFVIPAAILIHVIGVTRTLPFLALVLPFSIEAGTGLGDLHLFIPSEPVEGIICLAALITLTFNFKHVQLLRSLLFVVCLAYMGSFIFALVFSTMPIVSVKAAMMRLSYFCCFLLVPYMLFQSRHEYYIRLMKLYMIGLSVIVLYTLFRHSLYDFSKDYSGTACKPFFSDHTIYSASLTFLVPSAILAGLNSVKQYARILLFAVSALLILAIFFSFSRAAWISALAVLMFSAVLYLRIRFRWIMLAILAGALYIGVQAPEYVWKLRQNNYDSNARNAGIEEQVRSVTNTRSDQSNAERVNRWSCAIRMFQDKPWTGFGPGTYQFQYLDYQLPDERTAISVTDPYHIEEGKGGTAHNELLLALSENGILGFVFLLLIMVLSMYYGTQVIYRHPLKSYRVACTAALLGLVSFYVHSLFNNFLDADKIAFLFWSSIALIIVSFQDLKQRAYER